jgi:site-specific DNA-methyltransferase (adenine-specific)
MTPYYEQDGVSIYHGDCREVLPRLEPAALLIADIPYGEVNRDSQGLRSFDKGDADVTTFPVSEAVPLFAKASTGSVYVWCGTEQVSDLRRGFVSLGMTTRLCVWEKSDPSPVNGEHLWLSAVEACVFARHGKAAFNEHCKAPVFRGPVDREVLSHPTPKPLWLMTRLILASSNCGDVVVDPCCGSGTTLRAAKDMGRRAIGIDVREDYCEIAANRLRQGVLFPAAPTPEVA